MPGKDSIESDVKGFYFDAEKKKYFRITSEGCSNPLHPHKIRKIESRRNYDKKQEELKRQNTLSMPRALHILQGAGTSRRGGPSFRTNIMKSVITNIKRQFEGIVDGDHEFKVRDVLQCDASSVSGLDRITSAYSMSSGGSIVITTNVFFTSSKLGPHSISNIFPSHKIVDLKVIPVAGGDFAAVACQSLGATDQFVSIRPVVQDMRQDDHSMTFNFPETETLWSLCLAGDKIGVGAERKITLFDMKTSNSTSVKISGENVFVLEAYEGVMYAGTNKGNIHLIDPNSCKISSTLKVGAPLSNLKVSDNFILASGYENTLVLYDRRSTDRPLATFVEHRNDCRPHLSLCLDQGLGVATSSGGDHVIRSWSLADFKLSSAITDERFVNHDAPPVFHLSDKWKGVSCAMLVANGDTIAAYV